MSEFNENGFQQNFRKNRLMYILGVLFFIFGCLTLFSIVFTLISGRNTPTVTAFAPTEIPFEMPATTPVVFTSGDQNLPIVVSEKVAPSNEVVLEEPDIWEVVGVTKDNKGRVTDAKFENLSNGSTLDGECIDPKRVDPRPRTDSRSGTKYKLDGDTFIPLEKPSSGKKYQRFEAFLGK